MPPQTKNYTLGTKAAASHLIDLELPSGATCQARRPGVQGFIAAGVLDNFDQLTSLVQTEHINKNRPQGMARAAKVSEEQTQAAAGQLMADLEKLATGFQMIDRLVAYAITQPPVWVDYQLTNESDDDWAKRQEKEGDRLAVRMIELEDKLFIMQWAVGGSADLETFRKEFSGMLDGMATVQGFSLPAE
jgi:hypothetical protein